MNRLLHFISAVALVHFMSGCGQVEFELANGKQAALTDLRDNWVVINYWATWCKPCIEEVPQLNELNRQDNVVVLGVNFDGIKGSELANQASKIGIMYDMIIDDPSEKIKIERPMALPATILIDGSGKTRGVLYGPQTADSINAKLSQLENNG